MIIIPTEKRLDWQHAPVMLFFLVLTNILVFTLYQSADDSKYQSALTLYLQEDYLAQEWPVFQLYLAEQNDEARLQEYQAYHDDSDDYLLAYYILREQHFIDYLQQDSAQWPEQQQLAYSFEQRRFIQQDFDSVSSLHAGLIPSELSPLTFISHQFLHGDIMHLLGNLFFLTLCGFAVEAAIGHLRFLLFYLLSGIAGGALFAVMDLSSNTPLIGASGAISGVMAMYLALFRLKKIEFFYWFFIFVGYFRAPALFILPFYIGKELLDFYTNTDSNVAFMAHAGGFVAGSLLIGITLWLKPQTVNEEYIEEDQRVDPKQQQLAAIYAQLEKYRFTDAYALLQKYINQYGSNFDLQLMCYQLLRIHKNIDYNDCVIQLLKTKPGDDKDREWLAAIWQNSPEQQHQLDTDSCVKLAIHLATPEHLGIAGQIFRQLLDNKAQHPSLGVLARRLSLLHEKLGNSNDARQYASQADQLLGGKLA